MRPTKGFLVSSQHVEAAPAFGLVGVVAQPATFLAFVAIKTFAGLEFVVIFAGKRGEIAFGRNGIREEFVGSSMVAQIPIRTRIVALVG